VIKTKLVNSVLALGVLCASTASAHVVLKEMAGRAGWQEYVTVAVPHGCGNSPTTEVRVKIPDGVAIAVPEQKAGWNTLVKRRTLPTPIDFEGGAKLSEVVDEVVWSGGNLPGDQLGRFMILVRLPDKPDQIAYFKTIQQCETGETRWVDTAPPGEPAWKIWAQPQPSPFLVLKKSDQPQLGATMQQIAEERKKLGQGAAPR
jgi:uncharacterized protein YcnI